MTSLMAIDGTRAWSAPVRRVALAGALVLVAGLLAAGSGAHASEVVDLRIGAHSDFTRVVFELDTPAGYRIERAVGDDGTTALRVAIDASSIPRRLQSTKSLIGLVTITPEGDRSIAQIELKQKNLSLKEMILANPPRIVLDVLAPASAKPQPAPKPVVAEAKPAPKPEPKSVPKPAATPAPSPAPKAVAEARPPEPSKAEVPAPAPKAEPTPPPQPAPVEVARATPKPPAEPVRPSAPLSEPSEGGLPRMGMEPPRQAAPPEAGWSQAEAAKSARSVPKPPAAPNQVTGKPAPIAEEPGLDLTMIGLGLAAVVLLLGGVFFVKRRRAAADDEELGEDVFEAADGSAANPFAGFDEADQPALGLDRPEDRPLAADGRGIDLGGIEIEPDASELKEDEPVDVPARRQASMQLDGGATQIGVIGKGAASGAGGLSEELQGNEEIMKLLQEFERRVASLETRLDEVVDARERLERQVAAQTEELRVQRAAIARTQRAVRNLTRPEEEGPTEPALRDPQ